MTLRILLVVLLLSSTGRVLALQADPREDADVEHLVVGIQEALETGTPERYLGLLSPTADLERAASFAATQFQGGLTRAVVRLRDFRPIPELPDARRALLDVFMESGPRARLASWRIDVVRRPQNGAADAPQWQIVDQELLSMIEDLVKLSLNTSRQFAARDLTITARDFTLTLARGAVLIVDIDDEITGLVLLGDGDVVFSPKPDAERGQLEIFSGSEVLRTSFRRAFVRLNPNEFDQRLSRDALIDRAVNPLDVKVAQDTFDEFAHQSFALELGDLSPERWWLSVDPGQFLAEIDTRKHGTLTYARSPNEPEDISLFDREHKKNIAWYASEENLARRGVYYDPADFVDYDVLNYNIRVVFQPETEWFDVTAQLRLRVMADAMTTLNLRLAESFVVENVDSDELGTLTHLRVSGREHILVNLGTALSRDEEFSLTFAYSGRLESQAADSGALDVGDQQLFQQFPLLRPETRYVYSNRTYWYPRNTVSDYATATVQVTIPDPYRCIASGQLTPESPIVTEPEAGLILRRYVFIANQPARYLSFIVSQFRTVADYPLELTQPTADQNVSLNPYVTGRVYERIAFTIESHPRQVAWARALGDQAAEIVRFYTSLLGDYPFPSLSLAVFDHDRPGGQSLAYFAVLNQPLPGRSFRWSGDPVNFSGFPAFYLAHEVAHQWWGHAVGWKNYHEQWLSEGIAQYLTALYAQATAGDETFNKILRQMQRSAVEYSSEGPIYLGYRIGHLQDNGRAFRAIVYNKAAIVLHLLRLMTGDEVFFRALRRFYGEWRFRRAGTDNFRQVFEEESGLSLERFFQNWIHEFRVPRMTFNYRIERSAGLGDEDGIQRPAVVLRFEQAGEPVVMPVPVTLKFNSGASQELIVRVTDRITELRVPLQDTLRGVDVNRDILPARIDR